ncbi:MAG: redoxin domain-containing protein [Anaerolineaceae bacterium]|nr:redoxin domain-containing protein [Anaerolineaceae bacterium]
MSDNTAQQPSPTNSRLVLLGTLVVGIVATFVVVYALTNRPRNTATPIVDLSQNFDGVQVINPPKQVQDFTLINQNEKLISLSDFRGKMVLMFFGFTNCTDVCPVTLLQFKQIRQKLGDKASNAAFLFISVDPKRDTAAVIGDYLKRFDETITGLVGDAKVFENIKNDYDLEFVEVPNADGTSSTAYAISHTPNPFLIDASGKLVAKYAYGTDINLIVTDMTSRMGA